MKRDTQIQIKISSKEKDLLDRLARNRGLSLSELMRTGARFYGNLDDRVFRYASDLSRRLNIADHVVISNTVLRRMAEDAAIAEVHPGENLLHEFPITPDGVLTGPKLFERLKQRKLKQLGSAKGSQKP